MSKKNFPIDSSVSIYQTNSDLDNATGRIIGKSYSDAEIDFYIVLLDKPLANKATGLVMIESCLRSAP